MIFLFNWVILRFHVNFEGCRTLGNRSVHHEAFKSHSSKGCFEIWRSAYRLAQKHPQCTTLCHWIPKWPSGLHFDLCWDSLSYFSYPFRFLAFNDQIIDVNQNHCTGIRLRSDSTQNCWLTWASNHTDPFAQCCTQLKLKSSI